jgi:hypothetical protein
MQRKGKSDLNTRSCSRKSCISPARTAAARRWLKKSAADVAADETQQKLHAAAESCVVMGTFSLSHPGDAKLIRKLIRQRLARVKNG